MNCARCGADFPYESQTCPACGLKLRRAAPQQPDKTGTTVSAPPSRPVTPQSPVAAQPALFGPDADVEDARTPTAPPAHPAPVTYEAPPEPEAPMRPQPLKAPAEQYVETEGGGRRRTVIVVCAVVVLLAAAGAIMYFFFQRQPLSAPERTVQRFWQAVSDGNQEDLISLFTPESQSEASRLDIFSRDFDIKSLSTVLSSQEGSDARVEVVDMTIIIDGKAQKISDSGADRIQFDLKKVNGRWLIDSVSGLNIS